MNRRTVDRLKRIDREFYRDRADDFGRSRDRPWPGWERVLESLPAPPARASLSVLDLGCGNGRFAAYLDARAVSFDYLGVDSSARLLALARARLEPLGDRAGVELVEGDLLEEPPLASVGGRRFDLVAAFGLLHHVPSRARRRQLLAAIRDLLKPDGTAAISFWQFGAHERFRRRFVSWESFNRKTDDPVDTSQLEEGDHLLAWGVGPRAVRYCHWTTPAEARELLAAAGLSAVELYEADGETGDLNVYALATA